MAKEQFNRRLSEETLRVIRWWAKEDSKDGRRVTETEVLEQAVAVYDGMRAAGEMPTGGAQDPETQRAAEELGVLWECEPGEALKRAVLRVLGVAQAGCIAAGGAVESTSSPEPGTFGEPVEVVGIQVGVSNLPKNADCKHCGKKFAGARYATRCSDCEAAGHQTDPHGCDECIGRDGPA
jgi:hypothetical protein